MVSEWWLVTAVSLNADGGVRLIKQAKHYKHNEDGHTAPGVGSHGSVPLSHLGNIVTRAGLQQQTLNRQARLSIRYCSQIFTHVLVIPTVHI